MRRVNHDVVRLRGRNVRRRHIGEENSDEENQQGFPLNQEAAEGFNDDEIDRAEAPDVEEPAPPEGEEAVPGVGNPPPNVEEPVPGVGNPPPNVEEPVPEDVPLPELDFLPVDSSESEPEPEPESDPEPEPEVPMPGFVPLADDDSSEEGNPRPRANVAIGRMRRELTGNEKLILFDADDRDNRIVTRSPRLTISQLVEELPANLSEGHIDLMIMRSVTNGKRGEPAYQVKYSNAKNRNQTNSTPYSRLILCKVMNVEEPNHLVYIMVTKEYNRDIFDGIMHYRDNGVISIGSIVRMMYPGSIEIILKDDIPVIVTKSVLKPILYPKKIRTVRIKYNVESNVPLAFVLNNATLDVLNSWLAETSCNGYFCDKQCLKELVLSGRGCSCYAWPDNKTNMIAMHRIVIKSSDLMEDMKIDEFSSLKFSNLYQTKPFPASLKKSNMAFSAKFNQLKKSIKKNMKLINQNGGFTVIGWYKRGVIMDKTILQYYDNASPEVKRYLDREEAEVDSGKLTFHPVSIQPTDKRFTQAGNVFNNALKANLFDVSELNHMNY